MTRTIDFADGFESSAAPTTGAVQSTSIAAFVDDAAYVTDKGSAAAAGDLYLNTTSNLMRLYDGTQWNDYVDSDKNQSVGGDKTLTGTTTTINSTTLDVADVNITINNGGNDATSEGSGITVERTGTDGSIVYEDALAAKFKAGAAGSEIEIANVSSTQTLTNKVINGASNTLTVQAATQLSGQVPIANGGTNGATKAAGYDNLSPTSARGDITTRDASNNVRLAVGSANQVLTSDGTDVSWEDPTGGSGGTGINYITNDGFEVDETGWDNYADASDTVPVDGTGGSPTTVVARVLGSPLRGTASGVITKTASNLQGEGVSYDFTIDDADLSKPLVISFDYTDGSSFEYNGGTVGDESDVMMYIYDVTNAVLIHPLLSGLDGSGRFVSSFQAAADSNDYRLIFHVATTNAALWTLKIDQISVGPESSVVTDGPVTDWQAYTPSTNGFGTPGSIDFRWRRIGDSIDIEGKLTAGTVVASEAQIDLPLGLTIDSSITGTQNAGSYLRAGTAFASGGGILATAGDAFFNFTNVQVYDRISLDATVVVNGNLVVGTGQEIQVKISGLKIEGWGTGQETGIAVDSNRPVTAAYTSDAATSIPNNTLTVIKYEDKLVDTHGAYNTTTGLYTVPVSGNYRISGRVNLDSAAWAAGEVILLKVQKNGSDYRTLDERVESGGGTHRFGATGTTIVPVNAGDTLSIAFIHNQGAAVLMSASNLHQHISIEKVDTGSPLAALTEKVVAIYNGTGTNTALATGSVEILDFGTKIKDTHNAVTTGASWVFTAPKTATYSVSAQALLASTTSGIGDIFYVTTFVNAITTRRLGSDISSATSSRPYSAAGTTLVELNAGDTLDIRGQQNMAASVGLTNSINVAWVTIHSVD